MKFYRDIVVTVRSSESKQGKPFRYLSSAWIYTLVKNINTLLRFLMIMELSRTNTENNGKYLETEEDNFLFIDMEIGLDLKNKPSSFCVGSLEDDYMSLGEISNGKREVNILDLDRISNMFEIILFEIEKGKIKCFN